jgi:hypothetical protein
MVKRNLNFPNQRIFSGVVNHSISSLICLRSATIVFFSHNTRFFGTCASATHSLKVLLMEKIRGY